MYLIVIAGLLYPLLIKPLLIVMRKELCFSNKGCVYMGTVEHLCMELFRIGTDRPSVSRCLGTVLCRTVLINLFTHEQFQSTAFLSIHQEQKKFLKKLSHHTLVLRSLIQNFLHEQIFQLSSAMVCRISLCLVSKRT